MVDVQSLILGILIGSLATLDLLAVVWVIYNTRKDRQLISGDRRKVETP